MNKLLNSCLLYIFFIIPYISIGQQSDETLKNLPQVEIKSLSGKVFHTSDITANKKPSLICFWKTCCKPPINMLDAIHEIYEDWISEYDVILYAVSIDDSRTMFKVSSFVNQKSWEFKILLDPNEDFKRALNVSVTPHLFLIDPSGNIVYEKVGFYYGDEMEIQDQLEKVVNNMN